MINFLPGPVAISDEVKSTFQIPLISHRDRTFINDFLDLKKDLCTLVNANNVEIITGSGTLSNDIVAYQLKAFKHSYGLILVNGEFGERLCFQADSIGLKYDKYVLDWGESFSIIAIQEYIKANLNINWIWFAHCETSTGVLNPLNEIALLCKQYHIKVCVDCISSIGAVNLDLKDCYLATGTSGKALCSIAGLCMVFDNTINEDNMCSLNNIGIPHYFNLLYYQNKQSIPFTVSSLLVYALKQAVNEILCNTLSIFESIYALLQTIYLKFNQYNNITNINRKYIKIFNNNNNNNNNHLSSVITFQLYEINSNQLGDILKNNHCWVSYQSDYLIKRNLFQMYITRNTKKKDIDLFFEHLNNAMKLLLINNEQSL